MATMRDVALRAGVSQPTVSYVLNGQQSRQNISVRTQEKVRAAALELGYLPNQSARAMRQGRFDCVAILLSTDEHRSNLPQRVWDGIYSELAARDWHTTMARLPDANLTDAAVLPKTLRSQLADGLLIDYTNHIPPRMVELIRAQSLPAIWLNSQQETDCVYPDDFEAAQRAVMLLHQHGHTRIGYADFTHNLADADEHYSARDRRDGYAQAMKTLHLPPRFLEDARVPLSQRLEQMRRWLRQAPCLSAVIGYGRSEIELATVACAWQKRQIGRDLSLLTFDAPGVSCAGTEISALLVPEFEIGQRATQMLLQKIEAPQQAMPPQRLQFGFQDGATLAPPSTR